MEASSATARSAGFTLLVICVAASVALGSLNALPALDRPHFGVQAFIGETMGGFGLASYGPLIWWAYRQFRWDESLGPMVLWLAAIGLMAAVHWGGQI